MCHGENPNESSKPICQTNLFEAAVIKIENYRIYQLEINSEKCEQPKIIKKSFNLSFHFKASSWIRWEYIEVQKSRNNTLESIYLILSIAKMCEESRSFDI